MKQSILICLFFQFCCLQSYAVRNNVVIYGKTEPGTKIIRLYQFDYNYSVPDKKILAIDTVEADGSYKLLLNVKKTIVAVLIWDKVIIHPNDSIEINFSFDAPYNSKYDMNIVKGNNTIFYNFFYEQTNHWNNTNSKAGCLKVNFLKYFQDSNFNFKNYYDTLMKEYKMVKGNVFQLLANKIIKPSDTTIFFNEISGDLFSYLLRPFYKLKPNIKIPNTYSNALVFWANEKRIRNTIGFNADIPIYLERILVNNKSLVNYDQYLKISFATATNYFKNDPKTRDGLYVTLFNKIINQSDSLHASWAILFKTYIGIMKIAEYKNEAIRLKNYFILQAKKYFNKTLMEMELVDEQDNITHWRNLFNRDSLSHYYYLDIWASWCFPCIKEIRVFENFRNAFDSLNIKRITISIDSNPDQWKAASKKIFHPGELSFLLKKPQEFRNLLNIETIPRYLLVTNRGGILSFDAPISQELESIKEIIFSNKSQ